MLGSLLTVSATAAGVQDRRGAPAVVAAAKAKYQSIETLFVELGYAGSGAQAVAECQAIDVLVGHNPVNRNVGRWMEEE